MFHSENKTDGRDHEFERIRINGTNHCCPEFSFRAFIAEVGNRLMNTDYSFNTIPRNQLRGLVLVISPGQGVTYTVGDVTFHVVFTETKGKRIKLITVAPKGTVKIDRVVVEGFGESQ